MPVLDYRTAGESHGRALIVLIEGLPAGLGLELAAINEALRRRQGGFGRGGRMKIEHDEAVALSGLRGGATIGSPLALQIENADYRIEQAPAVHRPRPGHADFAGAMKWLTTDCRNVIERASARETAARVAAGAVAARLLREFGVEVVGFVSQIGAVRAEIDEHTDVAMLRSRSAESEVYCPDRQASEQMIEAIREARQAKDTVGGVVEVRATGLAPGIGSCMRWQDKLDGRLMAAVGSIQAIKGVEIGTGFGCSGLPGSRVHDAIEYDAGNRSSAALGFSRRSNRAGGIEGGMTNGMAVVVRAAMKPISTLLAGMESVNLRTLAAERSDYERSDICAVPAASVVAEHVVAFELARAMSEKFAGDTLGEMKRAYEAYLNSAREALGR